MEWLFLLLSLPASFAAAEEKYPKHTLLQMEIMSCRGGNGERQDVTAKVAKEKEVLLYSLPREDRWVPKPTFDPKPYVILNTVKISCAELEKNKINIFERAQKSEECKKNPAKWWCRHEAFNLLVYPPWLNDYK